jgi:hypothetical protein
MRVKRFDYLPVKGEKNITKEGYLQVYAPIATTGVLTYRFPDGTVRKELVNNDALFDHQSLETIKLKPVTNMHPEEQLLDATTVQKKQIGTVGETIKRDGNDLMAKFIVTDSEAINDINSGRNKLSPGYLTELDFTPGEYNGQRYDAIQKNRSYNHLAICDNARGGDKLQIKLDSNDGVLINDNNKKGGKMPTIRLDGIDYEASQEVINSHNKLVTDCETAKNNSVVIKKKLDSLEAERDTLKEKYESLKNDLPVRIDSAVKERTQLLELVSAKLDSKDVDGKSNDEIKKSYIMKVFPNANLDDKSSDYIQARFDSAIETDDNESRNDSMADQRKKLGSDTGPRNDSITARQNFINRLANPDNGGK